MRPAVLSDGPAGGGGLERWAAAAAAFELHDGAAEGGRQWGVPQHRVVTAMAWWLWNGLGLAVADSVYLLHPPLTLL